MNSAPDFAATDSLYLGGEPGGDHVDVINPANEFAQSLSDVLTKMTALRALQVTTMLLMR